ncbi:endo-polygalacturonase PG1 [Fomitiporia mediterranea MF3/22]|uniref:endo-polygalacturonase PG1 n=1 Tax=Fomitiporia mediterranea (strain MF3/22) TaxID=694068 RepID=UPI000440842F|nr:endo-polygalacturonase PG1 [Fomitiporia mediterranea MF3/22]EJD03049.1 endo-polygalacturonase PG1 [Fomitiporia mediterranea MF3/22]
MYSRLVLVLLATTAYVSAAPKSKRASDCTTTISSIDDATNAGDCTTVNINGFTVPAGEGFELDLADGTTVNLNGNVLFGNKSWEGPLFTISGDDITFKGNGHIFDGGGPFYWDGLGGGGGVTKPDPMMKIRISGTFSDLKVVNSPQRVFSVSNPGPLTISGCTVDNSQGDQPNANSDGEAAGHNTDGFDISSTDVTFTGNTVMNQDDCLAVNKGSNIVFTGNTCSGGHGISIGSISSDATVNGVLITNNKIINNDQALRIKTKADATDASVTNITYSGNTGTGMRRFGIIIDQSYPDTLGTPGNGVSISDISFIDSSNTIEVSDDAVRVAVNCGDGSCTGTWDWSSLTVTGGKASEITGFDGISGGSF